MDGYLAKDGETKTNARDVTLDNDRKLFLGNSNYGG